MASFNKKSSSSSSSSSSRSFVVMGEEDQKRRRPAAHRDEEEEDFLSKRLINNGNTYSNSNNNGVGNNNNQKHKRTSRKSMFHAKATIDNLYSSSGEEDEEERSSISSSRRSVTSATKKMINDKKSISSPTTSSTVNNNKNSNNPFLGAPYTKIEYTYAICVGVMLSFNAGYVNGSCLSGMVAPTGRARAVTSHTGTTTKSALALSSGEMSEFGFLSSMLLCFALGSFIAGSLTPKPTKAFRVEASYGPTFLIGAVLLTISSTLAALEVQQEQWIFYCAAAANGIQNGISSIYSKNLIRSTGVTGTTTDIGIFFGQFLRGNKTNTWKLIVLLCLWTSFWTGGLVSLFATSNFLHFSLLFNAGLFLLIGGSVVVFLRHELDVSWSQAVFGKLFEVVLAHEAATMASQRRQQEKNRLHQNQGDKEEVQTQGGDASLATTTASQHKLRQLSSVSSSSSSSSQPWWANVPTDFEC